MICLFRNHFTWGDGPSASLSLRGPSDMEPAVHIEGHLEGRPPPSAPAACRLRCEGASPKAGVETQPLRLQCSALSLLSCSDQLAGGPKEGRLLSQVKRPSFYLSGMGTSSNSLHGTHTSSPFVDHSFVMAKGLA